MEKVFKPIIDAGGIPAALEALSRFGSEKAGPYHVKTQDGCLLENIAKVRITVYGSNITSYCTDGEVNRSGRPFEYCHLEFLDAGGRTKDFVELSDMVLCSVEPDRISIIFERSSPLEYKILS